MSLGIIGKVVPGGIQIEFCDYINSPPLRGGYPLTPYIDDYIILEYLDEDIDIKGFGQTPKHAIYYALSQCWLDEEITPITDTEEVYDYVYNYIEHSKNLLHERNGGVILIKIQSMDENSEPIIYYTGYIERG